MGEHCHPHCVHRSLNAKSRCLDVRLLHFVFRASSQFIPGALNQCELRSSSVCYRKASGLPCHSSAAAWTPLESQPHPVPRAGRQSVFPNPDAVYKLIRNQFGTRASIDTAHQRCALLYSSCRGRCGVAQVVFRPRLVLHGEATREGRTCAAKATMPTATRADKNATPENKADWERPRCTPPIKSLSRLALAHAALRCSFACMRIKGPKKGHRGHRQHNDSTDVRIRTLAGPPSGMAP